MAASSSSSSRATFNPAASPDPPSTFLHCCVSCFSTFVSELRLRLDDPDVNDDIRSLGSTSCVFPNPGSSRCRRCDKAGQSCKPCPEMMDGDWADLRAQFIFVNRTIHRTDDDNEPILDAEDRFVLAKATWKLCKAYLTAVTAHTNKHGISGTKKTISRALLIYERRAERKRQTAARKYPAPAPHAPDRIHAAWQASQKLYLSGSETAGARPRFFGAMNSFYEFSGYNPRQLRSFFRAGSAAPGEEVDVDEELSGGTSESESDEESAGEGDGEAEESGPDEFTGFD
ncbi:hypothetical protein Forpe1208_v014478 [Fusarium oxysporum f. sp. rapae]|uniref:Uncharacterized protein n=1 Tax=Fusarium oxysporum f. sp. rapae TaxID=485398 RepID=A0A8J5NK45_FUSOX|nr:hypothetical protein Forpe1208_v014478 [Fusarium oxysporum f. sp. rapae]